jgi:hypothetical protein
MVRTAKNKATVDVQNRTVVAEIHGMSRKDKAAYVKTVTLDFTNMPLENLLEWASKEMVRRIQNRLNGLTEDGIDKQYNYPVNVQQAFVEDWHDVEAMIKKHGISMERLLKFINESK